MNLTLGNVCIALLWAVIAAAGCWLITWPARRHSLIGLLGSVVLTATGASVGALLGGVHSMLLATHDEVTVVVVAVAAGVVAMIAAGAAARRIVGERDVLRAAVADVAEGRVPDTGGRRLTSELEQLRRQLADTARALAQTQERERALEASRRELVSWVSHDLRTPLAGLRAMAEALEDGVADVEPEIYYKQIASAVNRLSSMVDDLFDLSRIQAGSFNREHARISLADLVSDCLAALQPLAHAQGVWLVGGAHQQAAVIGNFAELNRAVTNLIANAIRHTGEGGLVDVRVGVVQATDDSGVFTRAEVSVRDQCGGIPAQDLPRLFDVGYRGEAARTPNGRNPAGAGLGLAITRGIVEAHEGAVTVQNAPGGCQFRVLLPVVS